MAISSLRQKLAVIAMVIINIEVTIDLEVNHMPSSTMIEKCGNNKISKEQKKDEASTNCKDAKNIIQYIY